MQQAHGQVQSTLQLNSGVAINNDACLEQEADVMGARPNHRLLRIRIKGTSKKWVRRADQPVRTIAATKVYRE